MASAVDDVVGTHARKASQISFEFGSTYRIRTYNCSILDASVVPSTIIE